MELQNRESEKILIMGGTNFMGKTLLDFLAIEKPHAQVYCINRGKIYWNNEARKHREYQHYAADRKQHKDSHLMVKYLNEKLKISESNKWKAVVDFSGFKWRDVQSVLKAINGLAQRYIFISSDSVYNNQAVKPQLPMKEKDFDIEAQCNIERKLQKKNDKYGYNKLKCEAYIKRRSKVPSYCLRLPDVIGPYDNTDRFWTTLQWVKKSYQSPIQLSAEDQQKKLSFVYSVDVCRLIIDLINNPNPKSDFLNVGFEETPTLEEFIRLIGKTLGIEPQFKAVKNQSNNCFPSIDFGHISVQKLLNEYQFKPSSLQQAIYETVHFFEVRGTQFLRERAEMQRLLLKKTKNLAE